MSSNNFESGIFGDRLRQIVLAGNEETVMESGGRDFRGLGDAFSGVDQVAVIGYSSQGPAHAQNLRDSFRTAGMDTKVVVGLRENSGSIPRAEADGFNAEDGTLLTVERALGSSAMSLILIADAAMAKEGERYIGMMPSGSTLGLAHGFYLGTGAQIRGDVDVIGLCPKGMGPSVRRLYEQGSGINASFAVHQAQDEARACDLALGWSLALGSPYTFQTTLENEWRSDIFGERAMLLGGVHGTVEAMYAWKLRQGVPERAAYTDVVESLVGPISETISKEGLMGVYNTLDDAGKIEFERAYNATYPVLKGQTDKIYSDVSSGREIQEVIADNERGTAMLPVDGTDMWRVGEKVRDLNSVSEYNRNRVSIDPTVAGVYIAGMMAQVDILRSHGHNWSEVVNESIIEAIDSLNPYMRARGVAFMVDNCSETARRGSRKWAPAYQAWISQGVLPVIDGVRESSDGHDYFGDFVKHDVHSALKTLGQMRPQIDIAVA